MKRRRPRPMWVPVTLRWRRPRRWLPLARVGRVAAAWTLHVAWAAHVHLHFSAPARERVLRCETLRFFISAASHRTERIASNRHSTVVRAAAIALRVHRAYGGSVVIHHSTQHVAPVRVLRRTYDFKSFAHVSSRSALGQRVVPASSVTRERVHSVNSTASHWSQSQRIASDRRSTVVRATAFALRVHRSYGGTVVIHHATQNIAPVRLLLAVGKVQLHNLRTTRVTRERARSTERFHARELRTFRRFSSTSLELVRRQIEERDSMPPLSIRPAQLVWRREPRPPLEPDASALSERTLSPSRSVPLESIAARPASPPLAALQAARIDLDRLTDDVIRRVERRARIERERRGL